MRVSPVGDVSGDGQHDVAAAFLGNGQPYGSVVHVVYGTGGGTATRVGDRPDRGLRIDTADLRTEPVGIGDVNADGLGDVAFGAGNAVWVVFGRRDSAQIDTGNLGTGGFAIQNTYTDAQRGVITGIGDQNGDGRRDLAVVSGAVVKVVYTPASGSEATDGYTIDPRGDEGSWTNVRVAALGDVNADGRDDLAVAADAWTYRGEARAYGIYGGAAPGETVAARDVTGDGRGFEMRLTGADLYELVAVRDQNGDGRRDVAVSLWNGSNYEIHVGYSRSTPGGIGWAPEDRYKLTVWNPTFVDVGDQTGDGIADFAVGAYLYTARADAERPYPSTIAYSERGWLEAVGTVPDRTGDGRRELVLSNQVHDWDPDTSRSSGSYAYELHEDVPGVEMAWWQSWASGSDEGVYAFNVDLWNPTGRTTRWRPIVDFWDERDNRMSRHVGSYQNIAAGWTTIKFDVDTGKTFGGDGLRDSGSYYLRISAEGEYGKLLRGWWQGFYAYDRWFEGAGTWSEGPPPPSPPLGPFGEGGGVRLHTVRGSPRDDHLVGTDRPDRILSYSGNDVIEGRADDDYLSGGTDNDRLLGEAGDDRLDGEAGNDRLDGAAGHDLLIGRDGADFLIGGVGNDRLDGKAGRDRISAGAGSDRVEAADGHRDTIACGKGRDVIVADKGDKVRRDCEVVLRRAKKKR